MKQGVFLVGILAAVAILAIGLGPAAAGAGQSALPRESLPSEVGMADVARYGTKAVLEGASVAWTRDMEPVTLTGDRLPEFAGVAITRLFAYAYEGGLWQPVPLQIDEVDSDGNYHTENGLLDGNDELVFMAMDVGEEAAPEAWIPDPDSQEYARYAVSVTNPLDPGEEGWVYLYRSTTLAPPAADYVDWSAGSDEIVGGTYVVGYEPSTHPLVDSLELNGTGVDVLDRSKVRVSGMCWIDGIPHDFDITEEDLPDDIYAPPEIDGPIRVGGGTLEQHSWSYYSMSTSRASVAVNGDIPPAQCDQLDIDLLRQSSDWRDPILSGMAPATYYDSNKPAGAAIDGDPDSVPLLPVIGYRQVSGSRGTVVDVVQIDVDGGVLSNYYLDDDTPDFDDTGDYRSFADAGFRIDSPSGDAVVEALRFFLDPSLPNVGTTYVGYRGSPLEATAAEQSYIPPCEPVHDASFTWSPEVPGVGEAVTFSAGVLGSEPIEFAWDLGDGTAGAGDVITHNYAEAGAYTVTLTASNPCGQEVVSEELHVICEPMTSASFTWEPPLPNAGKVVTFTGEASGTELITYDWAFGDGSAGDGKIVTHVYALSGTYTVELEAANACGQATVSDTLTVLCQPPGDVDMRWNPTTPVAGEPATFVAEAAGSEPMSFEWLFGDDGSIAAGSPVSHTFAVSGTFPVTLTATNACGTAAPVVRQVRVQAQQARENYVPLMFCGYGTLPPCEELIQNGGFEDDTAWYVPLTPRPGRYTTEQKHSGARSMLLGLKPGEADVYSYSSARQTIGVPDTESVTLTFWFRPVSDLDSGDRQECLLLDENDAVIAILMRTNINSTDWLEMSYDLTDYAGQTIKVYFNTYNDGDDDGVAGFYVDDVSVEACTTEPPEPDCYPALGKQVSVGETPHGAAVNNAGKRVYVANNQGDTLSVVDSESYKLIATVAVGDGPNGVAYNPGNNQIYVANGHDGTVTVLRASDYGLVKTIAVGAHPGGIAVDAGANRVFVANYTAGTVSVIDGATNNVVKTLSVGSEPAMVTANPATHKAYVTLHGSGKVAVINSAYNVTLVDIYSQGPYGITVDGVRNLVYAATIDTNRIAVIDGATDTFVTWVEIRRSDGTPVPLRMIGVNADIGTSGHVFLTTVGEDGGFDKFLMLPKGWPEGFDAPRALDLSEGRDGLAFEPTTDRVFVTSRDEDLVATILDGEELCPQNYSIGEYQVWVCMERMGSTCTEYAVK